MSGALVAALFEAGVAGLFSQASALMIKIKTKSVFAGGIYFPIGVQIRFSRKNNLWNKLAFTAEVKSSLDFQGVPGNGILTRFYMNQSFGLKYYFENNSTK